jgi:hypothetical protein
MRFGKILDTFLEHIIVIEIYTLLTIIVFHKVFVLGIDKYIIGDFGDPWQSIWNIWWTKKSILERNWNFPFYTNIQFYPHGTSLVFHSLSLVNTIIAFPLTLIFNLITVYNILILLSFILSGYFMYLLIVYLIKDRFIALIIGFAFTFSPYHISKAVGYLNLLSIQWVPLFYLFFFKSLNKEKRRIKLLYIVGASLLFLTIVLSSDQIFIFLLPVLMINIIYEYIISTDKRDILYSLFLFCAIFLLFSGIFLYNFLKDYITITPNAYVGRHFLSASFIDYFLPSKFSIFFFPPLSNKIEQIHNKFADVFWSADSVISLGYTVVIFSFLAIRKVPTRAKIWLFCFIVSLFLSLGDRIKIDNLETENPINKIIFKIPGFNIIGTPSRMAVITLFSILIFLSFGLLYFRKKFGRIILIIVFIGLFLEFWPFNFNEYYSIEVPSTVEKIREVNGNFTIINIPFSYDGYKRNSHGLYLQTIHEKPIIDGYVSRNTKQNVKYLSLNEFNVKYIIIAKIMLQVEKYNEELLLQLRILNITKVEKVDENSFFVVYKIL